MQITIEEALSILESEITTAKEKEIALDFLGQQNDSPQAAAILAVLLKNLDYPDSDVQFHALMALENYSLVEGSAAAIQPLISYLLDKEKTRDKECRAETAYVLEIYARAQVATSELAIEPLLQTLFDAHSMLREAARDALGQFANSAHAPRIVQFLIEALSEDRIQTDIVYALLQFAGVAGIEGAIEPLVKLANSKDSLKRLVAISGLAELGSPAVIPVLQAFLHDKQQNYISDPHTNKVGLVAVGEMAHYALQRIRERHVGSGE